MPHDNGKVYGVLVIHCQDEPRVLLDVLQILEDHSKDDRDETMAELGYNVTHLWVRTFGPIGAIMLRFTSTEYSFRRFQRYGLAKMKPQWCCTLHRAPKPWTLDNTIPCTATHMALSGENAQSKVYEAMRELAANHGIDVAMYDYFESREVIQGFDGNSAPIYTPAGESTSRHVHLMRVFDLARRNENVLKAMMTRAMSRIEKEDEGTRTEGLRQVRVWTGSDGQSAMEEDEKEKISGDKTWVYGNSSSSECYGAVSRMAPFVKLPQQQEGPEYLYVVVHGLDTPGLMTRVSSWLMSMPSSATDGGNHDSARAILRCSCRGLGRQAMILVCLERKRNDDPMQMTRALREELARLYKAEGLLTETRHPAGFQGFWHAKISLHSEPPILQKKDGTDFVRERVTDLEEKKGILKNELEKWAKKRLNLVYANGRLTSSGETWIMGLTYATSPSQDVAPEWCGCTPKSP